MVVNKSGTAFFKDTANEICRSVDASKGMSYLSPCGNYVAIDLREYDVVRRSKMDLAKIARAQRPKPKPVPKPPEEIIVVRSKKK